MRRGGGWGAPQGCAQDFCELGGVAGAEREGSSSLHAALGWEQKVQKFVFISIYCHRGAEELEIWFLAGGSRGDGDEGRGEGRAWRVG